MGAFQDACRFLSIPLSSINTLEITMNWKSIARIGATIAGGFVPGALEVEQMAEDIAEKKGGEEKARQVVATALRALQAEGEAAGKNYATPRVMTAVRNLNDDSVELLNALQEAHDTLPTSHE